MHDVCERSRHTVLDALVDRYIDTALVDRYLNTIIAKANEEAWQRAERERDPVRRGFRYLSDTAWLASPWRPE